MASPTSPNIPFLPYKSLPTPPTKTTKPSVETPATTEPQLTAPERIKAKPIKGSPITHPAVQILNAPLPPPSPTLAERTLNPAPLNMENLKKMIGEAETKTDAELKAHKKDVQDVKARKVGLGVLAIAGGLTLMTATGAVCVFCPPAGAAVVAVGLGVGAVVGGGGLGVAYAGQQPQLTKKEQQILAQREETIAKALQLFNDYPKNANTPNGKSFEEFLQKCHEEGLGGPEFDLNHLKDYVAIFEKQQKLDEVNTESAKINNELKKDFADLKELKVKPDGAENPQDVPALSEELKRLKDENAMVSINSPYIDVSHINTSKNETRIDQLEKVSVSIAEKEHKIALLKNPFISEIKKREIIIEAEINKIKNLKDSKGNPAVENPENLPEIKEKIEKLKTRNEELQKGFSSEDPAEAEHKMTYLTELQANVKLINDLQTPLNNINTLNKEIDTFYDKITPTAEEIETDKQILRRNINKTEYTGDDLRINSNSLASWKDKSLDGLQDPVAFGPQNKDSAIGIFGTYNTRPRNGLFGEYQYTHHKGVPLGFNEQKRIDMGRSNKNNFLSNFYSQEMTVDGKTYPSSMHYILIQKIEKDRAAIQKAINEGNPPDFAKAKLERLKMLENSIKKEPSPIWAYSTLMYEGKRYSSVDMTRGLYYDMDKELKVALYHKFVGPDGTPTLEGDMLLKTGTKTLYAGNEFDNDTYFGMQFSKNGELVGENKLGIALMELRSMIKRSGADPLA
jgi:predicted NAD-dependent protein-ADP-ribosyltransferase YbiA (DUF1768 family)